MAKCVRVESGRGKEDRKKYVKYYYDDGTVEKRIGGLRAWRNTAGTVPPVSFVPPVPRRNILAQPSVPFKEGFPRFPWHG
jgi:hypothetical protein